MEATSAVLRISMVVLMTLPPPPYCDFSDPKAPSDASEVRPVTLLLVVYWPYTLFYACTLGLNTSYFHSKGIGSWLCLKTDFHKFSIKNSVLQCEGIYFSAPVWANPSILVSLPTKSGWAHPMKLARSWPMILINSWVWLEIMMLSVCCKQYFWLQYHGC